MHENEWEVFPKLQEQPEGSKEQEEARVFELSYCPMGHENVATWRHACPFCERLYNKFEVQKDVSKNGKGTIEGGGKI